MLKLVFFSIEMVMNIILLFVVSILKIFIDMCKGFFKILTGSSGQLIGLIILMLILLIDILVSNMINRSLGIMDFVMTLALLVYIYGQRNM